MRLERMCLGSIVLQAGLFVSTSQAATIYLADAADGDDVLNIGTYPKVGQMDVRLDTTAVDTLKVAIINAFLDSTDDDLLVYWVDHGQDPPFFYECEFCGGGDPIDGSEEYYLIMGDSTNGGGFPLGAATWILDSLGLATDEPLSSEVHVTFEQGIRHVTLFSSAPTFFPFTKASDADPPDLPNFVYEGVGNNVGPNGYHPFTVQWIPEPTCITTMFVELLVIFARRHGWTRTMSAATHA